MRIKPRLLLVAGIPIVAALAAGIAAASSGKGQAGGPIVHTPEQLLFVPNALSGTTMRFSPETIEVRSGGSVTFVDSQRDEPHTITVVRRSELPRTAAETENCKVCRLALGHLKDPRHPETSPIKTYVLDTGKAGFDERGDSLLITPGGPHKRGSVTVTAPAGTTLYYLCAIHPWMQGSIVVTS
jgi:plastocyanin